MPRCAEAQRETEAGGCRRGWGARGCSAAQQQGPPLLPAELRHCVLEVGAGGQVNSGNSRWRSWGGLSRGVGVEPAMFPSPGSFSSPAAPPSAGLGSLAGCGWAPAGREDEEDFTEPELDAAFAPREGCLVHSGPPVPLSPACGWAGFGFPRGAEELGWGGG